VARLQALCAGLPQVHLHLHDEQSGPLTAEALAATSTATKRAEVWFCGPRGFAETLRNGLRQVWPGPVRFHQEPFKMR